MCLIGINIIFLVLGFVVLGFGIYTHQNKGAGALVGKISIPVIIVGVGMVIMAFLGACGTWFRRPLVIKIYVGVLIFLLLMELIVGLVAVADRKRADQLITAGWRGLDDGTRSAIQGNFNCCGLGGVSDIIPDWSKNNASTVQPTATSTPFRLTMTPSVLLTATPTPTPTPNNWTTLGPTSPGGGGAGVAVNATDFVTSVPPTTTTMTTVATVAPTSSTGSTASATSSTGSVAPTTTAAGGGGGGGGGGSSAVVKDPTCPVGATEACLPKLKQDLSSKYKSVAWLLLFIAVSQVIGVVGGVFLVRVFRKAKEDERPMVLPSIFGSSG